MFPTPARIIRVRSCVQAPAKVQSWWDRALHLLGVEIEQFRSIEDQWVPAEGLVVLFGANSVGKTSVLEAAGYLITQAGVLRSDPGDNDVVRPGKSGGCHVCELPLILPVLSASE